MCFLFHLKVFQSRQLCFFPGDFNFSSVYHQWNHSYSLSGMNRLPFFPLAEIEHFNPWSVLATTQCYLISSLRVTRISFSNCIVFTPKYTATLKDWSEIHQELSNVFIHGPSEEMISLPLHPSHFQTCKLCRSPDLPTKPTVQEDSGTYASKAPPSFRQMQLSQYAFYR